MKKSGIIAGEKSLTAVSVAMRAPPRPC